MRKTSGAAASRVALIFGLLLLPIWCFGSTIEWVGSDDQPVGWQELSAELASAGQDMLGEEPFLVSFEAVDRFDWAHATSVSSVSAASRAGSHLRISPSLLGAVADSATYAGNLLTRRRYLRGVILFHLARRWDEREKLSKSPQFRRLAGWGKGWFRWSPTNRLAALSPDSCDQSSPSEALAANVAYYLLDPEFAYRRPAMYAWLKAQLSDPFTRQGIRPTTSVFLMNHDLMTDLSPQQVAEVHYLLAAPGSDLVSGWGHTLLRIVPKDANGKAATTAVADQTVLGYQALTLGDLSLDHLGGLMGKYPSLVFPYLFTDVYGRYVSGELRELRSYPLQLDEAQQQLLLSRLLEQYWCYKGSYRFLTRNCATEAREDLAAADGRTLRGMTPRGVVRSLVDLGAVDAAVLDDETAAVTAGLFFPELPDAKDMLKQLRKDHPKHAGDLRTGSFLEKSTAAERESTLAELMANTDDASLVAQFYQLETAVMREAYEDLFKAAGKVLKKSRSAAEGSDERQPWLRYEEALSIYEDMQPWNLVSSRYGVPLASEVEKAKPMIARSGHVKRLGILKRALMQLLKDRAPEEWRRHTESQEFSKILLQQLVAE